jgi:hypothetical protein
VAWLRRIIVSAGIGGVSYAIMFALMLLSVMYDRAFEPIITLAFDTGRLITNWLDPLVAGTYWGQVAVNHLRERVNMTHVVLSLPAIVIATIVVGIPLKLDAWRHAQCVSTHRDCRGQRTYRPLARCTALHFQRTRAGDVCCAPAFCRLDLANGREYR